MSVTFLLSLSWVSAHCSHSKKVLARKFQALVFSETEGNTKQTLELIELENCTRTLNVTCYWNVCCPGQMPILFEKPRHSAQKQISSVWSRKKMIATQFYCPVHQPTNINAGFLRNWLQCLSYPRRHLVGTYISYLDVVLFSTFHEIVVQLCFEFFCTCVASGNQIKVTKKLVEIHERPLFIEVENKAAENINSSSH